MKKVVLIPASFKGSLSSIEVIKVMKDAIHSLYPDCEIVSLPISDGGEGFVDAWLLAKKGKKVSLMTHDPFLRPIRSYYGLLKNGTALIELATTAGLHLVQDQPNPSIASTRGVGEQILHAISKGIKSIYLGLGGSATNDAGTGLIEALGYRFYDHDDHLFSPNGSNLSNIHRIDDSHVLEAVKSVSITILSDVTNPLYGPLGAAKVFAAQKGADALMVEELDHNLMSYSNFLKERYDFNTDFPGAGAAGGTPVSVMCFLNATLRSGIEAILEGLQFDDHLINADLVITGEGRLDSQSLKGKAIDGIAKHCFDHSVPCIAIAGQIKDIEPSAYPKGLTGAYSVVGPAVHVSEALAHPKKHVYETTLLALKETL